MKKRGLPPMEDELRRFGSIHRFTGGFQPRSERVKMPEGKDAQGRVLPQVQPRRKPVLGNGVQK